MRRSLSQDSEEVAVDLSPMIDCIFILLIFFIVTTVFVEETGVEVNKPDIGGSSSLDQNSFLIEVTSKGRIIYNSKNYSLQAISSELKRFLATDPEAPVVIQGDTKADHGLVQQVHGQCRNAGATTISVSSKN